MATFDVRGGKSVESQHFLKISCNNLMCFCSLTVMNHSNKDNGAHVWAVSTRWGCVALWCTWTSVHDSGGLTLLRKTAALASVLVWWCLAWFVFDAEASLHSVWLPLHLLSETNTPHNGRMSGETLPFNCRTSVQAVISVGVHQAEVSLCKTQSPKHR